MAVTQVGTPTTVVQQSGTATGVQSTITGTWSGTQPRTASDLLVAVVTAYGTTAITVAIAETTGGWTEQITVTSASSHAQSSIWTLNAAGGDPAPSFTATMTGTAASERMTCYLIELTGNDQYLPASTTGSAVGTSASPLTVTTSGTVPAAGCYAISCYNMVSASGAFSGFTKGASWTNVSTTAATSAPDHAFCDIFANPPSGTTLAEAVTHTTTTTFEAGTSLVVQPLIYAQQPIGTLSDPFHATTENGALWGFDNGSVTYAAGGVTLASTANTAGSGGGIVSLHPYNLTGGQLSMRLENAGNQALVSWNVQVCTMGDVDNANNLAFLVNQNIITAYYNINSVTTNITTVAYSTTAHKYFRIRENAGTTYWETSSDGNFWALLTSHANPFTYASSSPYLFVILNSYDYGGTDAATSAVFDNVNVLPLLDRVAIATTMQAGKRAALW